MLQPKQHPVILVFVLLIVWLLILIVGGMLEAGGQESLQANVERPVIAYFVAPVFLLVVVTYWKWGRAVGLKRAEPARSWWHIWFPLLIIAVLLAFAFVRGAPPLSVTLVILLNTLLIGFSEELMFRGFVFRGVRARFSLWPAIWITSIVFGLAHLVNGFSTGDFPSAFTQAFSATLLGIWFMALRLRTNSLYPGMLAHGLWDFSLFMIGTTTALNSPHTPIGTPPLDSALSILAHFLPVILIDVPLLVYGLILLRGISKKENPSPLSTAEAAVS